MHYALSTIPNRSNELSSVLIPNNQPLPPLFSLPRPTTDAAYANPATYDPAYLQNPPNPATSLPATTTTAPTAVVGITDPFVAVAASQDAADKWRDYSTSRRFGFRRQQSSVSSGRGLDAGVVVGFSGLASGGTKPDRFETSDHRLSHELGI